MILVEMSKLIIYVSDPLRVCWRRLLSSELIGQVIILPEDARKSLLEFRLYPAVVYDCMGVRME